VEICATIPAGSAVQIGLAAGAAERERRDRSSERRFWQYVGDGGCFLWRSLGSAHGLGPLHGLKQRRTNGGPKSVAL